MQYCNIAKYSSIRTVLHLSSIETSEILHRLHCNWQLSNDSVLAPAATLASNMSSLQGKQPSFGPTAPI